jgi:hypothetical protein
MIWLLPHPFSPPVNSCLLFLMSPFELIDRRGGKGWWGRSQIIRQRESLVLYKSFNFLCSVITAESKVRINPVVFISRLAYI